MGDETHMVTASRVPMLNPSEYELWKRRIRQYIRMIDFNMWNVIVNGDSEIEKSADGKEIPIKSAEGNATRKLEIKAHSILLMGIPNEFQMDFDDCESGKALMDAVKFRFGGNDATKKSRKNMLKHQFENFTSESGEKIIGTYNRLNQLVSHLKLVGYVVPQEDVNLKFLRSLAPEWSMHTVVWRNKPDFETMKLESLYNNLRVYESELATSSTSSSSAQNLAFVSSKSKETQESHSTAYGVSTSDGSAAGSNDKISTSDVALCAFLAELTTTIRSHVINQDMDHIDPDDLEEIDLKWQMAMLTLRARKFWKKTGREVKYKAKESPGFDKSKIECYNCNRKGHFARECRSPKKNADAPRKAEESKTALVSCDGLGDYDWSEMAEEEPNLSLVAAVQPKVHNFALMAYGSSSGSDSEVSNDSESSGCSFKSCADTLEELKARNDSLNREVERLKLDNLGYKVGIQNVERRLEYLKECEKEYVDQLNYRDIEIFKKNSEVEVLKNKLEEAEKEKETALAEKDKHVVRVQKQQYASDLVHKSIESTLMRKGSGIGYNEVAPPAKSAYAPPGKELSFISELEIGKSVGECSTSVLETPKVEARKFPEAPTIDDWNSDSDSDEEQVKPEQSVKKEEIPTQVKPKVEQVNFVKPVLGNKLSRRMVEYKEVPRKQMRCFDNKPRGNQRNFNNLVSQRLGNQFELQKKACYKCGSFDHLIGRCPEHQKPVWNKYTRVNHKYVTKQSHPHPNRNMVPRAVLLRSGATRSIYAAKTNGVFKNTTGSSTGSTASKHSAASMHYATSKQTAASSKLSTSEPKHLPNTVVGNHYYAVKASACWTWKPKTNVSNSVSKNSSASSDLKKFDYTDAQGRSKSVMAWVIKRN